MLLSVASFGGIRMRRSYVIALLIAVGTVLWLASGFIGGLDAIADHPTIEEANSQVGRDDEDSEPTAVRARVMRAEPFSERVKIRGHTENKRTVELRAETVGRVVERPVERGSRVDAGDLVCRLATEDRQARIRQAEESVNQARIEHEGSLRLKDGGFQSETAIAQTRARLAAAEAQLEAAALDLERTFIRAPFDGVVELTLLEVGDYAQPATPCARIVDLDPMLLVGQVSEREVSRLSIGRPATGLLTSGETVGGLISFIGHQADTATRTYRVEVTVSNPDHRLLSGTTAEIDIVVGEVQAHRISPAVLVLDDEGLLGVRLVDADDRARFQRIVIVGNDPDGVWVTGLPPVATLITVGHQLVVDGQRVEAQVQSDEEANTRGGTR
ncbi:MAG: efflux RND transporter periplasmic adaptor subunit [Gammaproteobacteria bacterium]|nr:efflux RND transporter periplasmic adaptor subunit [Gammaproteobacteria bacterium]